jgi:hypothetical protein
MRRNLIYLIILYLFSTGIVKCQIAASDAPLVLENLYDRLINNYDDNDRIRINDSIKLIIDSYVTSDSVFNHKFTNLKYLGQITSGDSTLKIITWNLVLGTRPGRYYCYFIRKQGQGKGNKIYRLTTDYHEEQIRTDTTYTLSDWYGALYYEVRPYVADNKQYWILLGIDYGNSFISRKIIDVLCFDSDDSVVFGKKWFVSGDKTKLRDVFEYASNAMMSLRFRSERSIVFDHLVPFSPALKDDKQYYGPDYSFDAYNFEDGLWRLSINVDVRNKE